MTVVTFQSGVFEREPGESVLDCLLRHRQHLPYACRAGMCQACLVKAVKGEPSESSRKWIKQALQERGYTLACQWVPETDVAVSLPSIEEFSVPLRLEELAPLAARVLRLRLRPLEAGSLFHCRPGQYLSLINPAGVARSYSIANDVEADGFLELHISATTQGVFTGWLFTQARAGDLLHARGPAGEGFYTREDDDAFPLLLAGTGSGLAPLYGVLRDALRQGHAGPLTLVHGARRPEGLYYMRELEALQAAHPNFHYRPCVLEGAATANIAGLHEGSAEALAADCLSGSAARTRAHLCGAPAFVHALRKKLYLKGLRAANIFCDPFIERSVAL